MFKFNFFRNSRINVLKISIQRLYNQTAVQIILTKIIYDPMALNQNEALDFSKAL